MKGPIPLGGCFQFWERAPTGPKCRIRFSQPAMDDTVVVNVGVGDDVVVPVDLDLNVFDDASIQLSAKATHFLVCPSSLLFELFCFQETHVLSFSHELSSRAEMDAVLQLESSWTLNLFHAWQQFTTSWTCPACTFLNQSSDQECAVCSSRNFPLAAPAAVPLDSLPVAVPVFFPQNPMLSSSPPLFAIDSSVTRVSELTGPAGPPTSPAITTGATNFLTSSSSTVLSEPLVVTSTSGVSVLPSASSTNSSIPAILESSDHTPYALIEQHWHERISPLIIAAQNRLSQQSLSDHPLNALSTLGMVQQSVSELISAAVAAPLPAARDAKQVKRRNLFCEPHH